MVQTHARRLAALILGAALAVPLTGAAQPAPTTAPAKNAVITHQAPQVQEPKASSPPVAGKTTSTAVPGWNNPPESWRAESERPQYASIPSREANRLIQGAGREWRTLRNGPVTQIGGWLIVLVAAAIIVFYLIMGKIKLKGEPTGRLIERFNAVERTAHWTMAITFVFMALTGIIIFFGKYLVLPWLGYSAFSWLTIVSKNVHNFVGPLFIFSIVVGFLLFVKDNLFRAIDWTWIKHFGGMYSEHEIPSGRFNGLEKLWFWGGVVLLGLAMTATGLILDFPNWNQTREAMQWSNMIHVIAAIGFICAAFGHIYIGTIGMEGAYAAMRDGYVDETWAKQHHSIWYDEVKQGRRPERIVAGTAQPAPGDD
jgi:formate dehydrogenase subunit gamma